MTNENMVKIKDLIISLPKSKIKAGEGLVEGNYPLYTCSQVLSKYLDNYIYDDEAIIIGTGGSFSIHYINGKFNTSTDCMSFKSDKVLVKYLYYFLLSKKNEIEKMFRGAGLKHLNKNEFYELEINIPSIDTQNEIIEYLDNICLAITNRKEQVNDYLELIKSYFYKIFGDPFNSEWQVKNIKDVAENIKDGTNIDTKDYLTKSDVLYLRIQNVWRNEFRLDDSIYISKETNDKYKDTSLLNGDILMTKIGRYYTKDSSLGRVSIYNGGDNMANYSNNIMRIRFGNEVNSEFANILLNLDSYQLYIRQISKGGTDKRALSKKLIEEIPIIVPPIKKQEDFIDNIKNIMYLKNKTIEDIVDLEKIYTSKLSEIFG